MLERKIRTFQSHALPAERDEVDHGLPASAAEIDHAERAMAKRAVQLPVHVKDKLLVRAVVDRSTLWRDVVGRFERHRIIRPNSQGSDRGGASFAPERQHKEKNYFPHQPIDPYVDLIPHPSKLATEQKANRPQDIFQHARRS